MFSGTSALEFPHVQRFSLRLCGRAATAGEPGPKTRIEVVTEGIFTRMILDDPELSGIGAVLFDEFHERSLDADLGLAGSPG